MGAALTCCRAPSAAQNGEERALRGGSAPTGGQTELSAATATGPAGGDSASPRSLYAEAASVVSGYHSAADGFASDGDEDLWHDALSELDVDLAEELERWEEHTLHGRDTSVDAAIEVGAGPRSCGTLLGGMVGDAAVVQLLPTAVQT